MTAIFKYIHGKYPFPPLVWFMIIETAFARGAFFLAMPFVAIKMSELPGTSPSLIGGVLGIGPLAGTIAGFYIGHLSDRWGRRKILLGALLTWSLVFLGFSVAKTASFFALLMVLNGLARAAFEPVSTALVGDLCALKDASGELQKSAFHLRYFAINIGASVAPLLGASLILKYPALGFQIAAAAYLISAVAFRYFSRRYGIKAFELSRKKSQHRFSEVIRVILRDKVLQVYLLAFFCLSLGFSQIDSILPLHLKKLFSQEGIQLFAHLLSLNGILVVATTLPLLKWSKRFHLNHACAASCLLWAIGYFVFGFAQYSVHFYWAMIFITLGEIIVFANGTYMIESLAPEKMKGAYLGTTNLGHSGVVIGPLLGGFLMELGGGKLLFSLLAVMMLLVAYLYLAAKKLTLIR